MQKKEDKVGNKTTNKDGKKQKMKARAKDGNRFAYAWKTKKLFNHVRLVGKYAFFLAKLVFSHSYAN